MRAPGCGPSWRSSCQVGHASPPQHTPSLPFPRIFENSQKNLRRARIKKIFRKWQALPKKIRDFWQFCSNFGGVLVILGHIFFVDFYFGGSGILTIGN